MAAHQAAPAVEPRAPLTGIQVLDISRVLAGPYCAQMLADLGADVIKVESPDGDENRGWGNQNDAGMTCNFASVNRGKRSITLNLKSPQAQEVLAGLVRQTDIVVQSFLPHTAAKLGVDYASIRAINPQVIHCSISGYGEAGPMADKPGYDLMMQAFSGVMSTTGYEGGPPVRIGISVIDMTTGAIAFGGVMTALRARDQGMGGSSVRASLLETAISLLGYHAVTWLQAGVMPRREGSGVLHLTPYQAFLCEDGHILTGATNNAAWRRLCAALSRDDLAADPRFATNDDRLAHREALVSILEAEFRRAPMAHWVSRFDEHRVAIAPLQKLDAVLRHPQVLANQMVVEAVARDGRRSKVVGMPFKLSSYPDPDFRAAPGLGEDTRAVLRERLGLDDDQIRALRDQGAL